METKSGYGKLKRWVLMAIIANAPKRTIRRIYIGALCGLLLELHDFDCSRLVTANRKLKFTKDVSVLRFYKWAYSVLWSHRILSEEIDINGHAINFRDLAVEDLTDDDIENISQWIINNIDKDFKEVVRENHMEKDLPEDTQTIMLSAFHQDKLRSV